jgi:DNA invertase Pin-like site-specific DNA recombinase
MTTAAIYARYSTDLQSDRSIDDQVALCRSWCEARGHTVAAVYADRAMSGASIIGRDGCLDLMAAVRDRRIDLVVVEAIDRLSRSQKDLADLWERLEFAQVELHAVHDGRADHVQVGIRGLVGALYLHDLKHKVRRGMAGVIRDARHAGGRAYGYRPVPGEPGRLEVVDAEAHVVRRICADYLAGLSPREIAFALNAEGVPAPRGARWTASTINGNAVRGHGILLNPLYAGRIVWNRVRMVKDPDTGRRVSRANPESEWQTAEAPELAIVDPGTWEQVQALKAARAIAGGNRKAHRPRHLLSGLLRCGACHGSMVVKDRQRGRVRIVCSAAREAGTCANRRPYAAAPIERAVTAGLRERLATPAAIRMYVEAYNDERRRASADSSRTRARLERHVARLDGEIARAIDMAVKGVISEDRARATIPALEDELAAARAELDTAPERPSVLTAHPAALQHYFALIGDLGAAIGEGAGDVRPGDPVDEARRAFRDLIASVTVSLPDADGRITIEVTGRLAALVGPEAPPALKVGGVPMVAEVRYRRSPPAESLPRTAEGRSGGPMFTFRALVA